MPVRNATNSVYLNDMLMGKILGSVEVFKDRNSLELTSQRLRALCLNTPITRRECYAIRFEADPNWPSFLTLLMRPRNTSSRLTVVTCSDVSEQEKCVIATYNFKDHKQNSNKFYNGISKRLLFRITEFEIINRRFSMEVLQNIERLPNLNRVIVKNARNFPDDSDEEVVDISISDQIQSLELVLNRQWCTEIATMKRLIGPNLKHFCCHVNPITSKNMWFIEEIMVEMAIQEVQLDQCQIVFPDSHLPRNLIVAFTQFMTERSQIMEVFVTHNLKNLSKCTEIVPTVAIDFRDDEDDILKLLYEACPSIFQKAKVIGITNIQETNSIQVSETFPNFYCIEKLHIASSSPNKEFSFIDQILVSLPSTVKTLQLNNCKMTTASIDILVNRGATSIRQLHLFGNGSCNTIQNFNKLLDGLQELKVLEIDMIIPHLLFPKIVESDKLETFIGYTSKSVPEKSLKILRQHFNHVQLKKIDRHKQQITVSNPSRSHL